jgi:hypothetical protein
MGIEDVMIEKEILRHCVQINPEIDGKLWWVCRPPGRIVK